MRVNVMVREGAQARQMVQGLTAGQLRWRAQRSSADVVYRLVSPMQGFMPPPPPPPGFRAMGHRFPHGLPAGYSDMGPPPPRLPQAQVASAVALGALRPVDEPGLVLAAGPPTAHQSAMAAAGPSAALARPAALAQPPAAGVGAQAPAPGAAPAEADATGAQPQAVAPPSPPPPSPPHEPIIVRLRIPRSLMPYRFQERPTFVSCLHRRSTNARARSAAAAARVASPTASPAPGVGSAVDSSPDVVEPKADRGVAAPGSDGAGSGRPDSRSSAASGDTSSGDGVSTGRDVSPGVCSEAGAGGGASSSGGTTDGTASSTGSVADVPMAASPTTGARGAQTLTLPPIGAALVPMVSPRSDRLADLEAVHRSAVALDLAKASVRGDSWLTGAIIDFIVLQFAKEYPNAQFLPSNFAVHDAPRAQRSLAALQSLRPLDIVGRQVFLKVGTIVGATAAPHPLLILCCVVGCATGGRW